MKRTPSRNSKGQFVKRRQITRRNPAGAGFREGGVFHPVRASPDYQPLRAHDLSTPVGRALKDWISGRAYVDNAGNYRLRDLVDPKGGLRQSNYKTGGKIAPWNKAAKKAFAGPAALHAEAVKESPYMPKRITDAHYSR